MSSKALPTQIPLAAPSRTFPARKAVPKDPQGMDRANFPSQSPRESKRGQEDKPVKMRLQLIKELILHFGKHSSTSGRTMRASPRAQNSNHKNSPWIN